MHLASFSKLTGVFKASAASVASSLDARLDGLRWFKASPRLQSLANDNSGGGRRFEAHDSACASPANAHLQCGDFSSFLGIPKSEH